MLIVSTQTEIIIKYLNITTHTYAMAKKENTFLLLSLEEEKAKKLASVISSEMSRKILDMLAEKEATESEIARELGMPISTVHYDLKQLVGAGLVKADEFHYSEKGKEVNHYSLANKYIIIAPKHTEGISIKLKRILPVFAIVAATGAIIQFFSSIHQQSGELAGQIQTVITSPENMPLLQKSAEMGKSLAESAAMGSGNSANNTTQLIQYVTVPAQAPNIAMWFAVGALFALIVYLTYDIARERFK